ncbi:MAG TPA: hypothetical protein VG964_03805 [Candidatus Saccharimonadales bacterium]|nr:hypothetical protein [Candidatus Saccharimonadales bacterium]
MKIMGHECSPEEADWYVPLRTVGEQGEVNAAQEAEINPVMSIAEALKLRTQLKYGDTPSKELLGEE